VAKAVKQISLQFDAAELDTIDAAARAIGMSRAGWIKEACRERLARQERRARGQRRG